MTLKKRFCFAAVLIVPLLAGCSNDRMDLHSVSGTVTFEDGTIPTGEMATITFSPANAMEGKGAQGTIEEDGSYQLWTLEMGDGGALAGDYRITLSVTKGYPDMVHQVAKQYTKLSDTPLSETVVAGKKNKFDFVIEKPGKRKKKRK